MNAPALTHAARPAARIAPGAPVRRPARRRRRGASRSQAPGRRCRGRPGAPRDPSARHRRCASRGAARGGRYAAGSRASSNSSLHPSSSCVGRFRHCSSSSTRCESSGLAATAQLALVLRRRVHLMHERDRRVASHACRSNLRRSFPSATSIERGQQRVESAEGRGITSQFSTRKHRRRCGPKVSTRVSRCLNRGHSLG